MALAASPPPESIIQTHEAMSEALDEEIAHVRAEIQALTQRRKLLASSLLSSTKVQQRLSSLRPSPQTSTHSLPDDLPLLLESSRQHSQSNVHRLAFGVTAFPFNDPSPECQSRNPMLGIRFDICDRMGRYGKPYYLFCRRISDSSQELHIHRHTIPALVPLQKYEAQYLPLMDEGYGGSEDSLMSNDDHPKKQDLHSLVGCVRHDLVSWKLRKEAIDLLCEELDIAKPKSKQDNPSTSNNQNQNDPDTEMSDEEEPSSCGKFGVREIQADVDATQMRIVWSDDRLGRIKIASEGNIVKVVVFDEGRLRDQERILSEGNATMYDLGERLEKLHNTLNKGEL